MCHPVPLLSHVSRSDQLISSARKSLLLSSPQRNALSAKGQRAKRALRVIVIRQFASPVASLAGSDLTLANCPVPQEPARMAVSATVANPYC